MKKQEDITLKRKFLLFFLAVVMTMLSIPVSASNANGISSANIVFTNSQLAGESYLDVLKSGTITDEFIRINNIEGQTTRSNTLHCRNERRIYVNKSIEWFFF